MNSNRLIVVGVDGSEGARRALDWAVREAAARGGAVRAVMAWSRDGTADGTSTAARPEEAERAARVLRREMKSLATRRGSAVPVAAELVEGRAADVLAAAGSTADLLVLGGHRRSPVGHTALGSVSEECVRTAICPVVVIPLADSREEPAAEPALRH
jgi:nucleotide-binding universal stress UspA family protein